MQMEAAVVTIRRLTARTFDHAAPRDRDQHPEFPTSARWTNLFNRCSV